MKNSSHIQKVSKIFYWLFSLLIIFTPLYYVIFWLFINQFPEALISASTQSIPFLQEPLDLALRFIGFGVGLLPLLALIYILFNIRKLFKLYMHGNIFSFEHARLFKKIAKGVMLWVIFSIIYHSAISVLFSLNNPPGQKVFSVSIGWSELTMLIVSGVILVIAWIMDEGRIIAEEQKLTV